MHIQLSSFLKIVFEAKLSEGVPPGRVAISCLQYKPYKKYWHDHRKSTDPITEINELLLNHDILDNNT